MGTEPHKRRSSFNQWGIQQMSSEQTWYVAEGVFEASVRTKDGDVNPVSETLLFLVRAADQVAAITRAETLARAKEHSYPNENGEQVTWTFARLVEVTEMIDQEFQEGAELKSKMTDRSR
jgi:hypothetical protein